MKLFQKLLNHDSDGGFLLKGADGAMGGGMHETRSDVHARLVRSKLHSYVSFEHCVKLAAYGNAGLRPLGRACPSGGAEMTPQGRGELQSQCRRQLTGGGVQNPTRDLNMCINVEGRFAPLPHANGLGIYVRPGFVPALYKDVSQNVEAHLH